MSGARTAADELYGLPAAEFTGRRNALVKEARAAGDRELAEEIGAYSKPSASAAAVNLLVREHPDDIDRLMELAARLRQAQDDSDGAALSGLGRERRAMLAQVGARASELVAGVSGRGVSAAVAGEIEQTLQAALADRRAAAAVQTGRLVRSLESTGLEETDLGGAVAGAWDPSAAGAAAASQSAVGAGGAAGRAKPKAHSSAKAEPAADAAEASAADAGSAAVAAGAKGERKTAERAAAQKEAERRLAEAERAAETAEQKAKDARSHVDDISRMRAELSAARRDSAKEQGELKKRIDELQTKSARLGDVIGQADQQLSALERDRARADTAARNAERAARTARERAERVERVEQPKHEEKES